MIFEKARISDISDILSLYQSVFAWAWTKTSRKFNQKFIKSQLKQAIKQDVVLVMRKTDQLVAFGWAKKSLDHFGNQYGEIVILLVDREWQKQGVGQKLLAALEKKMPKDLRLSVLDGNKSERLYRKSGYSDFLKVLRKK